MQGEVDEQQPNEIISEFGYYPVEVNIETEQFSLRTLPGLIENVERINNDKNVVNGWILRIFMKGDHSITSIEIG